jgi:hypothetical protein
MSLRTELRDELLALSPEQKMEARRLLDNSPKADIEILISRIEANRRLMSHGNDFDAGDLIRDESCR